MFSGLPGQAAELAQRVQRAMTGLAEAAGHEGLAAALMQTNVLNARRLTELSALYAHVQQSLTANAQDYADTDNHTAQQVRAAGRPAS